MKTASPVEGPLSRCSNRADQNRRKVAASQARRRSMRRARRVLLHWKSSRVNYERGRAESKEGLISRSALRSHFASVEAASYVLRAKSSSTSGEPAARTAS